MKPYFVEGQITININVEIEANSLEDAEKKAYEKVLDWGRKNCDDIIGETLKSE